MPEILEVLRTPREWEPPLLERDPGLCLIDVSISAMFCPLDLRVLITLNPGIKFFVGDSVDPSAYV